MSVNTLNALSKLLVVVFMKVAATLIVNLFTNRVYNCQLITLFVPLSQKVKFSIIEFS